MAVAEAVSMLTTAMAVAVAVANEINDVEHGDDTVYFYSIYECEELVCMMANLKSKPDTYIEKQELTIVISDVLKDHVDDL